jgi:hypothetical protein
MNIFKKQVSEEKGQGLVEYMLIVLLVALAFWVAIKDTDVGSILAANWAAISSCISAGFACGS